MFHEYDHASGYLGPINYKGKKFLKWKIKKALKAPEFLTPEQKQAYDYLLKLQRNTSEAYPTFAQIGYEMGLQPGQKGTYQDWLNVLERAKTEMPGYSPYLEVINPKKWYRGWDLLTGQYKKGGKIEQYKQLLKQLRNDK